MKSKATTTVLAAGFLFTTGAASAWAQTFTAEVVGVSDGDTITVYDGREQTRIRLEGVDCPEDGADFSRRAKEFTSGLVFGKQVRIVGTELDQYGRLVARVYAGETDVSLALVEAGLAWHYKQYSNDRVLAAAETVARAERVGVWSLPHPIPPWEDRTGGSIPREAVSAPSEGFSAVGDTTYHGNSRSRVYHAPGCRYYDCLNCTVQLSSKEEAARQGFRPHVQCAGAPAPSAGASSSASATSPGSSSTSESSQSGTVYHGNSRSHVYHAPGCQHYNCKNCTVVLKSKEEASRRGFRPHSGRGGCVR